MPAARFGIRLQAFLFDWVFIGMLAAILVRLIVPHFFPSAIVESNNWLDDFAEWIAQDGLTKSIPMPQWSEDFAITMAFSQLLVFGIFWLYFTVSDTFFSGYTFGKSICRLRTVSTVTMKKPAFMSSVARGGLKALAMFSPLILLVTIAALKFNKRRQMAHDLLCRTAVVDERYLSPL